MDDSERAWLEGEVRTAFREHASSAAPPAGGADPAVLLYEERLDADVVQTLEKKRGPAVGSGWRGFYDLAAVDAALPQDDVLDAARFLANRSREKVIVPLFVEAFGGSAAREGLASGPPEPKAIFWEGEAEKFEDLAAEIRVALQKRWGIRDPRRRSGPARGSA